MRFLTFFLYMWDFLCTFAANFLKARKDFEKLSVIYG